MKTLLLYGAGTDSAMLEQLCRYFGNEHGVSVFEKSCIRQYGEDIRIQIADSAEIKKIAVPHTVIYLKERIRNIRQVSEDAVILINSEHKKHRQFASKHKAASVSYGLSAKDTVTFSSRGDGYFVVSLQRSVTAVDGSLIEPMEIPCRVEGGYEDTFILAFVTILILLNEVHLSDGQFLLVR